MKIDVLLMRYNKNELSTQPRRYEHLGGEALHHLVIIPPRLGGELIFVISH